MSDKTTLDGFISQLMHDDDALNKFLSDPTNGGAEHGITKAERAVLRRVTAHLSNTSKNGFGIQRDLGSYRRSLRLLQNVLHKHGAAHQSVVSNEDSTYTFHIYITGKPSLVPFDPKNNPAGAPYTKPSLAYTNYLTFNKSGDFKYVSEAMNFNPTSDDEKAGSKEVNLGPVSLGIVDPESANDNSGQLSYKAIYITQGGTNHKNWYVESYTVSGFTGKLASNNGSYILPFSVDGVPVNGHDRFPFWFFSLGGNAIVPNKTDGYEINPDKEVTYGTDGASFYKYPIASDNNHIIWQAIAPDMNYGFAP